MPMFDENVAIEVNNISKIYRIGTKDEMQENLAQAIFDFIKNPLKNFRKYRSLYKFDDTELGVIDSSGEEAD